MPTTSGLPWFRRLLVALHVKPYLWRCPRGQHRYQQLYGDARLHVGAAFICQDCPSTSDRAC